MVTSNSWSEIAVVMGGGLKDDGSLPVHVIPRCEAILAKDGFSSHGLVITSSCFSLNCPPKTGLNGMPRSEASTMAHWLIDHGYTGTVMCEQQSHDTVGSIFFTLSLYASFLEIDRVKFITSQFHSDRVKFVANFVNEKVFSNRFMIDFEGVPDIGVTDSRMEHEKHSLGHFKSMFLGVASAEEFVARLFLRHRNYNMSFGSEKILPEKFLY